MAEIFTIRDWNERYTPEEIAKLEEQGFHLYNTYAVATPIGHSGFPSHLYCHPLSCVDTKQQGEINDE